MKRRAPLVAGAVVAGLVLTGCGSASGPTASQSTHPSTIPSRTATPPSATTTTVAVTTGAATCPTLAQTEAALGGSYSGPTRTPTQGGGVVCEYTGGGGTAAVAIFAHQSATVFAGQVAHAPGAPAMPSIAGVGDGAFGETTGGRSIVNAYANASRTLVAAQASTSLPSVEALAKVALADN